MVRDGGNFALHPVCSEVVLFRGTVPVPLDFLEKEQDLWIVAGLRNLFLSLEEVTHYD